MPDYPEDLMQEEKMDRIVEKLEGLMLDALLSILQKLQERIVRSRRLKQAHHPIRPYFYHPRPDGQWRLIEFEKIQVGSK